MKSDSGTLLTLAGFFALTSMFAIGVANSTIPEIRRFAVDVQHWLSDRQFADSFALAQITPGPNLIIVTLIGYRVGGVEAAIVSTLVMCAPPCVIAYLVGRTAERFRGAAWHGAISRGVVPVTLGLTAASAILIVSVADINWVAGVVTLTTAVTAFSMRLNPLWAFAVAALLGAVGLI
jgi:chromate transporter